MDSSLFHSDLSNFLPCILEGQIKGRGSQNIGLGPRITLMKCKILLLKTLKKLPNFSRNIKNRS